MSPRLSLLLSVPALLTLGSARLPAQSRNPFKLPGNPGDAVQQGVNKVKNALRVQAGKPENDNFASSEKLEGAEARATADNRAATIEKDEPVHLVKQTNQHTVWWTWKAPATGRVTLDTLENVCRTNNLALVAYDGDSLDTLLPVMRSLGPTNNFKAVFPVEAGHTYHIVSTIPSYYPSSAITFLGQVGFNLHFKKIDMPPPVIGRDKFADRAELKGAEAFAVADNRQTGIEANEPIHLRGQEDQYTVWWTWTAPATGKVTIDTLEEACHTDNLALVVYAGDTLDTLLPVMRGIGQASNFKMTFPVAEGRSYQFVSTVPSRYQMSASTFLGRIGFNLHFKKIDMPPPVIGRDKFADRAELKGAEAFAVADNRQAAIEFGEPEHTRNVKNERTVWWTWTAPANGNVTLDTLNCDSGVRTTALAVYTGNALDSLVPVAQDARRAEGYKLAFPVKAGTTYQIVANGYDENATGYLAFNLHFQPVPPKPVK